ncbi:hypothetical protein EDD15DRAFT_1179633 [Pisolithus albus]|nr:hypothetical protein EDD15DRAFT_1179633 [Pisolithus albus]
MELPLSTAYHVAHWQPLIGSDVQSLSQPDSLSDIKFALSVRHMTRHYARTEPVFARICTLCLDNATHFMVILYVAIESEDAVNRKPSVTPDDMHHGHVCFHHSVESTKSFISTHLLISLLTPPILRTRRTRGIKVHTKSGVGTQVVLISPALLALHVEASLLR